MEELVGPLQDVFKDLRRQWQSFQEAEPFLHVVQGFIHAIDWREPWIIGILAFHVAMFLAAVATRKRTAIQTVVFMLAAGIVFMSERLNRLAGLQWERFSTQNYFDATGVFMSAVVSAPLIIVMFIVLINYLLSCASMLVEAKKRELKHRARQRAKDAKAQAGGSGGKKND
ncbi:Transmembrane protein 18 [Tetrabaena socialis]|uniref:Transmembrane protein 18 n=1 Tax=Tetrabaena socialis TaxID=47790 RepID=A0A2J8A2Z8_9CHLO|nr:Transmembrane protein 18 [Tetrabaena socialis]|eukprot:PNH06883.1 Transmembrane protein 18 [Tetrabaena socialis]